MSKSTGYDLLYVAIHELGHSLGLGHSDVSGSIMAGQYPGYMPDVQLHPDDIAGIQYIYGRCETYSINVGYMQPNHCFQCDIARLRGRRYTTKSGIFQRC